MTNKYWQSFGELNDDEGFKKQAQDEFREELPFEDMDGKGLLDAKTPRRDFLKYLGFSTAAATLAASCEQPVRKIIPFANRPENLVPGAAKYYATTYVSDGDVLPVIAKVRDGRPIKIEGNELSYTGGGTSAQVQASVLDLYDMYRNRYPMHKIGDKFEEVPSFEKLDKTIADVMAGLGGSSVVILTSTITSPTTKDIINAFVTKHNGQHIQYDEVSYSGLLAANEATFGNRSLPSYCFGKADVIVSLGADFLGTWLSPVEFAKAYAKGRKIDEKAMKMSKHYQFESMMSMTGANADERITHRPSETGKVAMALYAAIGGEVAAPAFTDAKLAAGIKKVADDLVKAAGKALVVCGSNDKNIQVIINAINSKLGAYGNTIDWSIPVNYRKGNDKEMADLVAKMDAGQVGALLIFGANPAYSFYDAGKFRSAINKVKLSVSFGEKMDETTELCNYIIPTHHYLESWGEAEAKAGHVSFLQPTINPLFKTRYFQTALLNWAGDTRNYETYFKEYWKAKLGGTEEAFNTALQNGFIPVTASVVSGGTYNGSAVSPAAAAIGSQKAGGNTELVIYQKISIGTGKHAGNPWLQELPDPITKATWDNYAMISMTKAKELGIKLNNDYEYHPEKPVVKVTVGNKTLELPVLVIPGMNGNTIAIAVGYGRSEKFAKASAGAGQNAYPFTSYADDGVQYYNSDVKIEKSDKPKYKIAQTQIHNSYENRKEVVRETSLASFIKYPNQYKEFSDELAGEYGEGKNDYRGGGTLYGSHTQPGIKWGMNIDMNSCTACGACVVACHAENNVPVVGKREVARYHDMHWLRIDRYFVSDEKNPDDVKGVVFQPMLCQHCDNAPCENVCPVAATNHSTEGLNQMTYNRCIGTRYCANNCPYKVRRFNWADYTGADSFPNNRDQQLVGKLDEVIEQMNDDLTRMVLNPDVTVRSRGVIEKCSFCVQRLQAAKLDAKKAGEELRDGTAKTACMTACPTEAIVFGNVRDEKSKIAKERHDNPLRIFTVLEQIHTLPNVTYLAKIRNTDEMIVPEDHGGGHEEGGDHAAEGAEKKEEGKTAEPAHH
jgi:MoCo/4Fe-4S cofactor protein with predicted Tat translocation signal